MNRKQRKDRERRLTTEGRACSRANWVVRDESVRDAQESDTGAPEWRGPALGHEREPARRTWVPAWIMFLAFVLGIFGAWRFDLLPGKGGK